MVFAAAGKTVIPGATLRHDGLRPAYAGVRPRENTMQMIVIAKDLLENHKEANWGKYYSLSDNTRLIVTFRSSPCCDDFKVVARLGPSPHLLLVALSVG
jgi:hypothetical protein